jgi:hypothetical protein
MIDVYTAFDGLDKVDIDSYKSRTRELVVRYDDIKHLLKWHNENKGETMDKNSIMKIGGVAAIVLGSTALYLSGTGADAVTAIVGAVFVLAGLIAALFKK